VGCGLRVVERRWVSEFVEGRGNVPIRGWFKENANLGRGWF